MVDRLKIWFAVLGPALLRLALLAVIGAIVGTLAGAVAGLWVAIVGLVILLAIYMSYATRLVAWLM